MRISRVFFDIPQIARSTCLIGRPSGGGHGADSPRDGRASGCAHLSPFPYAPASTLICQSRLVMVVAFLLVCSETTLPPECTMRGRARPQTWRPIAAAQTVPRKRFGPGIPPGNALDDDSARRDHVRDRRARAAFEEASTMRNDGLHARGE